MSEEAKSGATTAADIPERFSMAQLLEECWTTARERQDFLDMKLERRKIGEPEANLARYRIARIKALGRYLQAIADGKVDEKPAPPVESRPPAPELVAQQEAKVESTLDDFDD